MRSVRKTIQRPQSRADFASKPVQIAGNTDVQPIFDLESLIKELEASASVGIPDTGEYDESKEDHMRGEMSLWVNYAETGPSFDPEGKYLCGTCEERIMDNACRWVSGKISMTAGSCRLYAHGPDESEKEPAPIQLTQIEAQYGERPETKAFSCSRCQFGAKAKKPDGDGRPSWCSFFGVHVEPSACCAMERGPDSK